MAVQRRYCELTNREIVGFATSQLAAESLGEKANIRALNTARAQVLESAHEERRLQAEATLAQVEASLTRRELRPRSTSRKVI